MSKPCEDNEDQQDIQKFDGVSSTQEIHRAQGRFLPKPRRTNGAQKEATSEWVTKNGLYQTHNSWANP